MTKPDILEKATSNVKKVIELQESFSDKKSYSVDVYKNRNNNWFYRWRWNDSTGTDYGTSYPILKREVAILSLLGIAGVSSDEIDSKYYDQTLENLDDYLEKLKAVEDID